MFILDTNVVSELRKIRLGRADARVAQWADSVETVDLYLSTITVQELELACCWQRAVTGCKGLCFGHGWISMFCLPLKAGFVGGYGGCTAPCKTPCA